MRKKIKKYRADTSSDASRSTDSSPGIDKKKKEGGFMRRMGAIGKKRAEESTPTPPLDSSPSTSQIDESTYPTYQLDDDLPPLSPPLEDSYPTQTEEMVATSSTSHLEEVISSPSKETIPSTTDSKEVISTSPKSKNMAPLTSHSNEAIAESKEVIPNTELKEAILTYQAADQSTKTKEVIQSASQPKESTPLPPQLEAPKYDSVVISKNINSENTTNSGHSPKPLTPSPEPLLSPIAVEHAVATRPFTKEAWKRKTKPPEIPKPVEEPSPGNALKRRIAFVSQASACLSEEHDDDDDDEDEAEAAGGAGEVGSLEKAVALARVRLSGGAPSPSPPHSRDNDTTEEEGSADTMPAYGDLIEPDNKAGNGSGPSHATPSAERREHLYKILVIGELGTGKTSIIKRYVHQFFSQHYRATIGVDFALKVLNWDLNTIIRLQLWDIAGQERFGNMTRVYYKEAVGAFIVFDVSRVATFDAVVKWKNDLDTKVQLPDGSPIPCILLANKCDQQKEGIVNSSAKMEEYCREKGFAGWFETSAKENINIEEAARSLVNKILLNDKLLHNNDKDGDRFALDHKIANGENSRNGGSGKSCAC
ncbi:uncharacterized protein Rab32 isoform X1 [Battus philenor]|uniref:uncharacterized protein Rab32 isoform X1 n=1 Tax=Battus philenor TaxID=42288 RepID=UPI0035CEE3BA